MRSVPELRVAGLVLAAGGSRRLGRAKQLVPYGDGFLLEAVLETARSAGFDQLVVALGGSSDEVRHRVNLHGFEIADNPDFTAGCSSSIAAAVPALDPRTDALVLLLGDQPGVRAESIDTLVAAKGLAPLAVCRYDDGVGHPFAFDRSVFGTLAGLHGDKAIWKLLEQRAADVVEVPIAGTVPIDVDTEDDYERVLAELRVTG